MCIEFYSEDGKTPIEDFLDGLAPKHRSKALRELDLLEEFGQSLKEPYVKHLKGDIWELRIKFSSDISRIFYFTLQNETAVLLHGFVKKTQKTPKSEIAIAENRMKKYKEYHSID